MESSTSLYDLYRNDRVNAPNNASQATTLSGIKKSASQAYFDRYPERKGKGPYIPSPKLTSSTRSSRSEERNSERSESKQVTRKESESSSSSSRQNDLDVLVTSETVLTAAEGSQKRRPGTRVASSKAAEMQEEFASTTPTSSASYASTFFSGSSPGYAPPRHFTNGKSSVAAAAAASRSPSGYPIMPSSFQRRFSQKELIAQVNSDAYASSAMREHVEEHKLKLRLGTGAPSVDTTGKPRRRLKAQQSMPNVRIDASGKKLPDILSEESQKPWPVLSSSGRQDVGRGAKPRSNGSPFSQATSSNSPSIDDVVRRNTPDIILPRSASSRSDVFTQSLGRRSMTKKSIAVQGDEHESDSSLDSIEKEIRHSMRVTTSSDEAADASRPRNSSESSKTLPTSPSMSILFGKKKATSSILNQARRLPTLYTATTSSPSPSDNSPITTRNISNKKYPNLAIPSTTIPPSPVNSPSPRSPSYSKPITQDDEIRSYLQSKKLTTLMTLSRLPFQGLTVSFADVGDPDGHPVFVFLGLGAVRYLVGLYDEMATVLHLRLICIDRWGQGKTDDLSAKERGVLDWSSVVVEVADRLEINRFSLLAHSAGAPYAMATCLVHQSRIAGPVHLLAPWVGPTVESGYKWLKYVPDGVIKTAQAADWRMQAWKLGLSKSPLVVHSDDLNRNVSQEESVATRETCSPSPSFDAAFLTPTSTQKSLRKSRSGLLNVETSPLSTFEAGGWTVVADPDFSSSYGGDYSGNSDRSTSPAPLHGSNSTTPAPPLRARSSQGPDSLSTPSLETASSTPWSPALDSTQVSSYSVSELTTALMRASHAENLRGGATNDLLVILGRSSQKPWGFSYTDILHNVIVWQGDKDERVSLSSVMWMEREMKSCCVNLVKNANHSLMTNVAVVVEALESISTHR